MADKRRFQIPTTKRKIKSPRPWSARIKILSYPLLSLLFLFFHFSFSPSLSTSLTLSLAISSSSPSYLLSLRLRRRRIWTTSLHNVSSAPCIFSHSPTRAHTHIAARCTDTYLPVSLRPIFLILTRAEKLSPYYPLLPIKGMMCPSNIPLSFLPSHQRFF